MLETSNQNSEWSLTAVNLFIDTLQLAASNGLGRGLRPELWAMIIAAARVESALEGITLPSKEVVAVLAVAGPANSVSVPILGHEKT